MCFHLEGGFIIIALYWLYCPPKNDSVSKFVTWDHGKGMHFFVSVPTMRSILGVSTFQLSPGLTRKFLYQEFAFIHCYVSSSIKSPSHQYGPVLLDVIWTHENAASSPNCLQRASTTQLIPLQQAVLFSFYSPVWMPGKRASSGGNGSFYLGHQTCVCC